MQLPISDYAPDLPANNAEGMSVNVQNLYPRTPESWGPINSLAPLTNALSGPCIGAYTTPDADGNNFTFAADSGNLWMLSPGSTTWSNKGSGFSVPSGDFWQMCLFGQNVIANAYGQPIQTYTMGSSGSFSELSSNAPQARYAAVVKDFYMVGNTWDAGNLYQPQRIQWSAINDPTTWPASGSNEEAQLLAGSQIIPGDQGWIQGLVGNLQNADVAVFFERSIWRGVFQGSPTVFGFYPVEGLRGTPSPRSIVQSGMQVFYLGEDGFYAFDGTTSTPIGANRVDRTFYANVNQSYLANVVGAVDPVNRLVMWIYPSTQSASGVSDSMLVYNWIANKWGFAKVTAEYIFRALSQGYSLEGLDAVSSSLDALPFSLDSRVWTGGNIVIGAFDPTHKLGYFTGTPLPVIADTVEVECYPQTEIFTRMNFAGNRAFAWLARPQIDGGSPMVQIGARDRLTDSPTWTNAAGLNRNGDCPIRAQGRYLRARVETTGGFNHLQGVEISIRPGGRQ